jgi:hypothetical protein
MKVGRTLNTSIGVCQLWHHPVRLATSRFLLMEQIRTPKEVFPVPPVFHMDSTGLHWTPYGLQWTHSTAKSTHVIYDRSGVEWSGVHWTGQSNWSPYGLLYHQYNPIGVDWTPVDSSGLHWTPLDSTGLRWTGWIQFTY